MNDPNPMLRDPTSSQEEVYNDRGTSPLPTLPEQHPVRFGSCPETEEFGLDS